jgi:hypothetical protein
MEKSNTYILFLFDEKKENLLFQKNNKQTRKLQPMIWQPLCSARTSEPLNIAYGVLWVRTGLKRKSEENPNGVELTFLGRKDRVYAYVGIIPDKARLVLRDDSGGYVPIGTNFQDDTTFSKYWGWRHFLPNALKCAGMVNEKGSVKEFKTSLEKWCDQQRTCEEDLGKGTFTCSAHMAEARAPQCPYKSNEDRKSRQYPCQDYQPVTC